jgi:hypothetical protein
MISWELSSKTRIFLAELLCFAEPKWLGLMDRHERRRRKRLEAKLQKKLSGKAALPPPIENKESPTRIGRALRAFQRTVSRTRLLWTLLLGGLSLAGGYALFRPHISVEPYVSLDPVDPYKTQFVVKNENRAFNAYNVECVCWPRRMESGNGFSVLSLGPLPNVKHTIPSLEAGDSSTIDCPPIIGGIGTYSGQVDFAELEIVVSYKQSWWPHAISARYPFRAVRDVSKAIHWVHTTPAEEKPILSK